MDTRLDPPLPLYFGPLPLIPSLHIVPELKTPPSFIAALSRSIGSYLSFLLWFFFLCACAERVVSRSFPAFLANSQVLHHFCFRPGLLSSTSFLSRLASGVLPVISFLLGHHRFTEPSGVPSTPIPFDPTFDIRVLI